MSRPISTESVFRAVAHSTRRQILDLLQRGDKTPQQLADNVGHSRPTLSAHLRVLRTVGLISERRAGRGRIYTVHPRGLRAIAEWIRAHEPGLKSSVR